MAQKKFYRYLNFMVMATFFTVLFALNTLAAPAGGIGEIIGLEEGVTYEAKPVTINTAGNGYTMGDAVTLDEAGNKNLAGLYVVSSDSFTTWSDLIYVQGSLEGRQHLGTTAEGTTTINATRDRANAADVFKVGYYYGASYGSESSGSVGAAFQTDYVFSSAYWKGNNSPYGYYDPWPTPTGLQAALDAEAANDETYTGPSSATIQSQVKAMLESYSLNYAYTSDEIIPVNELLTMKIGVSKRGNYDNFKISPITSKVVFLVMDEDGNVTEHTWTGESKALTFYASTIIEETIDVQSISTLPEEGWIVAFKYYPVGYISEDAITVGSTGRGTGNEGRRIYDFNLRVGYDESVTAMADYYVIAKPKAAAPTGVKYDAGTNTISGLTSGTTYTLAPYDVLGAGTGTTYTTEGTTYKPATALTAGLWGVSVNASEANSASDPYIIYVEGSYKDRAHLGTETDGVINTTRDRNGVEWKSGYYFGVNKKGYAVANKFCNAYAFNGSKTTSYFGAEFIPTAKALADAITAETNNDTTYTGKSSSEIKTQVKTILENYYVSYAYTSDEIIPVDELLTV
ncbi:MAG: hypothetical protein IJ323_02500, partial [Clostridia bacterium]|nr:hypothetical protein [Clostridia bacterium]